MQRDTSDSRQLVYPTVVAWPDEWERARQAELITSTGALDPATARLTINREVPLIIGCFDPPQSAKIVHAVRTSGGDAFAPSMADLVALGSSSKVRDLRLVDGNIEVDIWRGLTTTIRREHVQVLVRGTIKNDEATSRAKRVVGRVADHVTARTRFVQYGSGARMAAQRSINRLRDEARSAGAIVSEMVDIHAANGSVFQIDGDKFAYTILGDMKGYGDKANMDRLCELLAHVSPNEVVDEYFSLFRPPPKHHLLGRFVPELRRNGEDLDFAFYSRWTALLYRHVMGVRK